MTRYVFAICMLLVCFSSGVYANDDINCEVNHSLYHDDFVIKAFYRFIISKGSGVILINGKINDGKTAYVISREIRFAYSKKSAIDYILINGIIHKNPLDNIPDVLLMKHYPTFFIENGNSLTFRIKRENKNDFIMSFVSTPFFYCNGSSVKR
ncbi:MULTISPECIES: hypothetical protein [unclassified Raoultella]|uniref:hypothetical protein n=1 Tax=unclassified Raoultella TaxID=2627600 RepID=UPI0013569601|nr:MULTISPECIES: hypothetical protein [unclassified Raoultella]